MTKPNLIYILADDMGYGDISALNENCGFRTPNLDEMAEKGWCNDFEPHLERSNGVPRGSLTRLPVAERSLTAVTEQVLTPEEAQKEAARCMACGRAFEANRTCWFCLPCEIDCPEEALTVRMPYLVR